MSSLGLTKPFTYGMIYNKYVGLLVMAMQSQFMEALLTHHNFTYDDILTKWSDTLTNSSYLNHIQALQVLRKILDSPQSLSHEEELSSQDLEYFETQAALLDQWWKAYGVTGESHNTL